LKAIISGIIGGVIGGALALSLILLFPAQLEEIQEFTQLETMHPCQQIMMDMINLQNRYEPGTRLSDIEAYELQQEYEELLEKEVNCAKYSHQWRTPEFVEKMESMIKK